MNDATESQIKQMTDRFLAWRLPEDFHPDCGISFTPIHSVGTPAQGRNRPVGTNLFNASQAEAMVRYLLETPSAQ